MIRVLGLADLMAGFIFLGKALHIELPILMVLFFALYLIAKGIVFVVISLDAGSFIDVAAGLVLAIAVLFQISPILLGIFAVFLVGKGFFSLFAS